MNTAAIRKDRLLILVAIGVLAAAGGVWGWSALSPEKGEPAVELPKELSADALKADAKADPRQAMNRVREAFRNDELTDEQREQLRRNTREVWRGFMNERLNEYFAASETERAAILDRHIDEFQARRREWEKRRAERERERASSGERSGDQRRGGPWRGSGGTRTREERKARSEGRNPDEMARYMAYFTAMRKRAEERGIETPGRGGPGGGRRGR